MRQSTAATVITISANWSGNYGNAPWDDLAMPDFADISDWVAQRAARLRIEDLAANRARLAIDCAAARRATKPKGTQRRAQLHMRAMAQGR